MVATAAIPKIKIEFLNFILLAIPIDQSKFVAGRHGVVVCVWWVMDAQIYAKIFTSFKVDVLCNDIKAYTSAKEKLATPRFPGIQERLHVVYFESEVCFWSIDVHILDLFLGLHYRRKAKNLIYLIYLKLSSWKQPICMTLISRLSPERRSTSTYIALRCLNGQNRRWARWSWSQSKW